MIEINIEKQNKILNEKIRKFITDRGMIIIASSDQNWNSYILLMITQCFTEGINTDEIEKKFVSFGEKDQYSLDWVKFINIKDINSSAVVLAGDLHYKQKTIDAFKLSEKCVVIGIVHVDSMDGLTERFCEELNISKDDLSNRITLLLRQT